MGKILTASVVILLALLSMSGSRTEKNVPWSIIDGNEGRHYRSKTYQVTDKGHTKDLDFDFSGKKADTLITDVYVETDSSIVTKLSGYLNGSGVYPIDEGNIPIESIRFLDIGNHQIGIHYNKKGTGNESYIIAVYQYHENKFTPFRAVQFPECCSTDVEGLFYCF